MPGVTSNCSHDAGDAAPPSRAQGGNWSSSTGSNSSGRVRAIHIRRPPVVGFDSRRRLSPGWFGLQGEPLMYFPAEHLLNKLQISAQELSDLEKKGIVKGIARVGRVFYSSRDLYRLKGILLFMTRGFD